MNRTPLPRSRRAASAMAVAAAYGLRLSPAVPAAPAESRPRRTPRAPPRARPTTPRMTIAMVTHAPSGDTFWDTHPQGRRGRGRQGQRQADLLERPETAADQANLVQNAIDQKVDGIARHPRQAGRHEGRGREGRQGRHPRRRPQRGHASDWQKQDLLSFFGQDEAISGEALGDQARPTGTKHAPVRGPGPGRGQPGRGRCAGVEKGFKGKTDKLYVNGADMPSVKSTITAKLKQDSSIDQVVTLGAPIALTAAQSVDETDTRRRSPLSTSTRSSSRRSRAAPSSSPSTSSPTSRATWRSHSLWLHKNNGNYMGGGEAPILTGPAFVDQGQRRHHRRVRREGHSVTNMTRQAEPAVTTPPAWPRQGEGQASA